MDMKYFCRTRHINTVATRKREFRVEWKKSRKNGVWRSFIFETTTTSTWMIDHWNRRSFAWLSSLIQKKDVLLKSNKNQNIYLWVNLENEYKPPTENEKKLGEQKKGTHKIHFNLWIIITTFQLNGCLLTRRSIDIDYFDSHVYDGYELICIQMHTYLDNI